MVHVEVCVLGRFKNNKVRLAIMSIDTVDKLDEHSITEFKSEVNRNIHSKIDKFSCVTIKYKITFKESLRKPIEHLENLRLDIYSIDKAINRIISDIDNIICNYPQED